MKYDEADPGKYDEAEFNDLDDPHVLSHLSDEEAEGVALADRLADDTFDLLAIFADAAGAGYPLAVSPRSVSLKGHRDDWPVYSFLLALSQRYLQSLSLGANRPARLFERLSVYAWKAYLPGEASHFGFPRSAPIGQRSFTQAAPEVLKKMGERLNIPASSLLSTIKDLECDVFAWRPFEGDLRRGTDILLGQCAIGDGWNTKDVNIDRWRAKVTFAVVPRKGSSFPFIPRVVRPNFTEAQEDADYEDLGGAVGLWLDRLRLARLLGADGTDAGIEEALLAAIKAWTELVRLLAAGEAVPSTGEDLGPAAQYDNEVLDDQFKDLDESSSVV